MASDTVGFNLIYIGAYSLIFSLPFHYEYEADDQVDAKCFNWLSTVTCIISDHFTPRILSLLSLENK
jgi:hypothetical protein